MSREAEPAAALELERLIAERGPLVLRVWERLAAGGPGEVALVRAALAELLASPPELPGAPGPPRAPLGSAMGAAARGALDALAGGLALLPEAAAEVARALGTPLAVAELERLEVALDRTLAAAARTHAAAGEAGRRIEEELRREAAVRERLIGIVGHDLRNPLGVIRLSLPAIRPGAEPEAIARATARIASAASRMERIIADVLDFTRARLGGGIPIVPQRADLAEVALQVAAEFEVTHPRRVVVDAAPLEGPWDASRIAQVLSNLVSNAVRHGAPDAPVTLRVHREDGAAVLSVHNRGAPIPPGALPTLFDPFRRAAAHPGEEDGGLGLGLYIVDHLVRGHGGEVDVTSTAEEGTTFTVRLPAG